MEDWIDKLDITNKNLNKLLDSNPSLRGMIMGYLAEIKLKEMWFDKNKNINNVQKADDHNRDIKADWIIEYKNKKYTIEVKSIQTNSIKILKNNENSYLKGKYQCDASDSRIIHLKNKSIKTTCIKKGQFDILAINLYPFTGNWEFAFIINEDIPTTNYHKYSKETQKQLLKGTMTISYPFSKPYYDNIYTLLNDLN